MVNRIENGLAMLSGTMKSNFCINKGDNDDYKILLPYYFEMQNELDNPINYVPYRDIKVKLKSNYGVFTENSFVFNKKDIAKTKVYDLAYNHYAFPEVTSFVETTSIPSSMPLDQELANGEYSKYMMYNFANEQLQKSLYLKRYGMGRIDYDPISISLNNVGTFNINNTTPSFIKQLQLSSFFGHGN
jgi:hypothetical protein